MKANNVLTIGIAYKIPKGGVAACEHAYSTFYEPFYHVPTVVMGNKWEKLVTILSAWPKFFWYLLTKDIKIVHVQGASNASFWRKAPFILISKMLGKKVVYHMHGGGFREFSAKHIKAVKYVVSKCDAMIALSGVFKEYFEKHLDAKKVVIIENPVETAKEDHSLRTEGICNFLFLGLVNKAKGVFDLIEVVNDHKEELRGKAKFVIGGVGEMEKMNSYLNEHGIEDIVEAAGWVAGEDKTRLLNEADVFILPSYIEGVPICILEAEVFHLPIVSTNIGGIPTIVKHGVNGYTLTAGDKKQLGDAIMEMVNDKDLREKMGMESYQFAEPHLTPVVEGQLIELYNSIL